MFARAAAGEKPTKPAPKPSPEKTEAKPAPEKTQAKPEAKKKSTKKPVVKAVLPSPLPEPSPNFKFVGGRSRHADTPPHLGAIRVPIGRPGCLQGITFTATGTLDSITRDDLKGIIAQYGGRLTGSVSGKTDILIRGVQDVGPGKLEEAEKRKIPVIDECGFLWILKESNPEANAGWTPRVEEAKDEEEAKKEEEEAKKVEEEAMKEEVKSESAHGTGVVMKEVKVVVPRESEMFTDRHKPVSFADLVGNEAQIKRLREWLRTFDKQKLKCALLSGPPGIGKTTSAVLAAKAAGFHVLEFNASDTRNKGMVESLARDVFNSQTLLRYGSDHKQSLRTCVVFDEIDGMSGGDRGGVQALAKFIDQSKIPIICICNDRSSKKLEGLARKVLDIPFEKPSMQDIARRLNDIAEKEGLKLGRPQMSAIISKSNGDMRSALNTLQFWSTDSQNAQEKDLQQSDVLKALADIFHPTKTMEEKLSAFFVDYDLVPEYVHEHLYCQGKPNWESDWADALDCMALGNEVQNQIRSNNSWELLNMYGVCSCVLPSILMPQNRAVNRGGYVAFPQVIAKQSKVNKTTRCLAEFALRSGRTLATSTAALRDCVADLLTLKFFAMLEHGQEADLLQTLSELELTQDDVVNLREIADFGLGSFPDPKVMKPSFKRLYSSAHTQSQSSESQGSMREDYYIRQLPKKKRGRK